MRKFGWGQYAFGPAMVEPMLAANAEDIAWAEDQIGRKFAPFAAKPGATIFDCEEDIIEFATSVLPLLADFTTRPASPAGGPEAICYWRTSQHGRRPRQADPRRSVTLSIGSTGVHLHARLRC